MTLNKPNPRLAILRAQLDAEADAIKLQRFRYKMSNAIGCSCPVPAPDADSLPLPPSYSEDLEQWLAQREIERVHEAVLERQSAARSVAPAKPAEPEPSADVWHSEAPSVAGVYVTRWAGYPPNRRHWDGSLWSEGHSKASRDTERQDDSDREAGPVEWLCLIEADAQAARLASTSSADGAALVGAKLTHSVCIKAYVGASGFAHEVGLVFPVHFNKIPQDKKQHWLPCDKDGFIPHEHTETSVCPIPEGMRFEARSRDGNVRDGADVRHIRGLWRTVPGDTPGYFADFVAWRPIADDSK